MSLNTLVNEKTTPVTAENALTGREQAQAISPNHFVNGMSLKGPWPQPYKTIILGLGCFWGAERLFWQTDGVIVTAVGYSGGYTPNPTYEEVCTGKTGHAEVVLVVYNPEKISLTQLLQIYWEAHDPTQGMRQGGDIGTQYRSAIYLTDMDDLPLVKKSASNYQEALHKNHMGDITTEIVQSGPFYYADDYHQQYLAKIPDGYCGLKGTGVACLIPQRA